MLSALSMPLTTLPNGAKCKPSRRGVISIVDEQLRGSGIRAGACSERNSAANVACLYGVILDSDVPSFGHSWVGGDAKLRNETGDDPEITGAIVVVRFHEVEKAISADGGVGSVYLNDDRAA